MKSDMQLVEVVRRLNYGGKKLPGDRIYVPPHQARQMIRSGRVRVVTDPLAAVGAKPSASPAAPVSRRRTFEPSSAGETPPTDDL